MRLSRRWYKRRHAVSASECWLYHESIADFGYFFVVNSYRANDSAKTPASSRTTRPTATNWRGVVPFSMTGQSINRSIGASTLIRRWLAMSAPELLRFTVCPVPTIGDLYSTKRTTHTIGKRILDRRSASPPNWPPRFGLITPTRQRNAHTLD
jgi:hypothetical protein